MFASTSVDTKFVLPQMCAPGTLGEPSDLHRLLYDYIDNSQTFFSTALNQLQSHAQLDQKSNLLRTLLDQRNLSPLLHEPVPKRLTVSSLLNDDKTDGSTDLEEE